jgi:4-azaleucine resistance transporter AzlC
LFVLTNSRILFIISIVCTFWRTLERGQLRDIAVVCLGVGVIGLSYGSSAVTSGLPLWVPLVLAVLVFAGASELLFVGIIAAGGSPVAAVLAGLLVNARHVPYGLGLPDVVGTGWRRLLGTHVMNDESVVFALSHKDPARSRAAYWVSGLGLFVCWPLGAVLGALLGTVVHDTDAFGLDAMFPAVLLALVLPALRERDKRLAALTGAAIALAAAPLLPAGLPVLLALAGLATLAIRRAPGTAISDSVSGADTAVPGVGDVAVDNADVGNADVGTADIGDVDVSDPGAVGVPGPAR